MRVTLFTIFLHASVVNATLLPVCDNPKPQKLKPGAVSYIDGEAQSSSSSLKQLVDEALTSEEESYFSMLKNFKYNWICDGTSTCTLYTESSFNRLQNGIADSAQNVYYRTRQYFDIPAAEGGRTLQELLVTQRSINRDATFIINGVPMKEEKMAMIDSYINSIDNKKISKLNMENDKLWVFDPQSELIGIEESMDIILNSPDRQPIIALYNLYDSKGDLMPNGHVFIVIKDNGRVMVLNNGKFIGSMSPSKFTSENWTRLLKDLSSTSKIETSSYEITLLRVDPK